MIQTQTAWRSTTTAVEAEAKETCISVHRFPSVLGVAQDIAIAVNIPRRNQRSRINMEWRICVDYGHVKIQEALTPPIHETTYLLD